ncbi:hypothetical protein ABEZ32_23515 [Bacillus mycoides]|uniref:hypothetical protein n=1 Tax=Bacillus mycoides TaxID=1405 RepID=UPI003D1A0E80
MNVEIFKISLEIGWPTLKGIFTLIFFYFVVCLIMMYFFGSKAVIAKKMLLILKVTASLALFGFTLMFQYNPDGHKIFFDWPKEITLIQMFLLPIILIDICISIIEVLTPEKY